jgi:hypothetical protein
MAKRTSNGAPAAPSDPGPIPTDPDPLDVWLQEHGDQCPAAIKLLAACTIMLTRALQELNWSLADLTHFDITVQPRPRATSTTPVVPDHLKGATRK